MVNTRNACKLKSDHHSWISFLDSPQSNVVILQNFIFGYLNLVTKFKHIIYTNDIITLIKVKNTFQHKL